MIPLLEQDFYVVRISYDGFDETQDSVFPGMLEETEKIEGYISENFDVKVECAYGCSLGSSFVGLLIQRKNIHINHAILVRKELRQINMEFNARYIKDDDNKPMRGECMYLD